MTLEVSTLEGGVLVAYRKRGAKWYATALQFDIVGVGKTKAEAFQELRELFDDYVRDVLATPGATQFFNPSPAEDWETKDKQACYVTIVTSIKPTSAATHSPVGARISNAAQLRSMGENIRSVQLQPVG